jgi:trimeric autotransporter adhesin
MKRITNISDSALALFAFASFAMSPAAQAICQDGCLSNNNTALGEDALIANTTGNDNTAIGLEALFSNTTGSSNAATGFQALLNNTTGSENTANGYQALLNNSSGASNTASGMQALVSNTIGLKNSANGSAALYFNTSGSNNTATGFEALFSSSTGVENTAIGSIALLVNTTGNNNTAIGHEALKNSTTGSNNIAVGDQAGINLTTGSSNIDVGNTGVAGESRTIRIGMKPTHKNTFIAGISGVTVPAGVGVIVDSNGHLGTVVSSRRFKKDIQPMSAASEAILSLEPVTFRYNGTLDPNGIPQFGLVAEDVAKVDPDLVARDEQGKPYTVRYEAVNAMLLNEFLKEHRKVEALEVTVAAQQKGFESQIAALTASLKAQAAQIQKVSDQLGRSTTTARVVADNQ